MSNIRDIKLSAKAQLCCRFLNLHLAGPMALSTENMQSSTLPGDIKTHDTQVQLTVDLMICGPTGRHRDGWRPLHEHDRRFEKEIQKGDND